MPLHLAPESVEQARSRRIAVMQAAYARQVAIPQAFTTAAGATGAFAADTDTVTKLQQMLAAFNKTQATPDGFYFKDTSGTRLPMTYADLQDLAETLGRHGLAQYITLDNRIDDINAAASADGATVADVLAVQWSGEHR